MAQSTRICKICGKEYPYCKTKYVPGVFRYQDVACCPEHGSEYLARVIASREKSAKKPTGVAKKNNLNTPAVKKVSRKAVTKVSEKTAE